MRWRSSSARLSTAIPLSHTCPTRQARRCLRVCPLTYGRSKIVAEMTVRHIRETMSMHHRLLQLYKRPERRLNSKNTDDGSRGNTKKEENRVEAGKAS